MLQIGIAAHSEHTDKLAEAARAVVNALANMCRPVIVVGGYWGVMRDVVDEALRSGLKVVIVAPLEKEDVNYPSDAIVIKTGCSFRCRSNILVRSSDALIVLGGGVGTIIEALTAYAEGIPVHILMTGMPSDRMRNAWPDYFDDRKIVHVKYYDDPIQLARSACESAGRYKSAGG